jgi:16S rRNA (cytidine1402-2'-O)-methyltransferase
MVKFIPTPIGNIEDITIRALREFEKTTLFLCEDTRKTKQLLKLLNERLKLKYPKDAEFISFHEHNGKERLEELKYRLKREDAIYVSDAGTPNISDPGQLLVEFCQKEGISYDVLPGATALTTAYCASGFESGQFTFFGFLPQKGLKRRETLYRVMNSETDSILYEAPHRIEKLIEEISLIDENRELFLAKELTKLHQNYYRGLAKDILRDFRFSKLNSKGEWVVLIKSKISKNKSLGVEDILNMDLPPKIKSKLLSKITNYSSKEWYKKLNINSK